MSAQMVITDEGGVRHVRFARPEKKNAITAAMYDAFTVALHEASAREDIRVVLVSAEGSVFTAGNDLQDFLAMPAGLTDSSAGKFIRTIATFDKPVVAAVNGPAIGVGMTLLLHCDLVYAAPEASFRVPFVDLGLTAEGGSSLLLPALLGHRRAAAMLLMGEPMTAADALAAGLVNAVVADGLLAFAAERARMLAEKPQSALRATRALMLAGRDALHAQMRAEEVAFSAALRSPEARAAFAGFLQRRD